MSGQSEGSSKRSRRAIDGYMVLSSIPCFRCKKLVNCLQRGDVYTCDELTRYLLYEFSNTFNKFYGGSSLY